MDATTFILVENNTLFSLNGLCIDQFQNPTMTSSEALQCDYESTCVFEGETINEFSQFIFITNNEQDFDPFTEDRFLVGIISVAETFTSAEVADYFHQFYREDQLLLLEENEKHHRITLC